ncbi:MAG TPA: MAPEG family protein [bacterium]
MSNEMKWLAYTITFTALLWAPYVLNRLAVRGLTGVFANPLATDTPLSPWAQRAKQAHANAVENLVLFAPAILAVHVLNLGNGLTNVAGGLYFFARVAHFAVYTAGIPVARTLIWTAGWVGIMILALRLLGVV